MSEFKKEDALRVLNKRKQIKESGIYNLRVAGVNDIQTDNGPRTIVNLQAMTGYHAQQAIADIKEGDFSGATNHNLTVSFPTGDSRFYCPQPGELVKVEVDDYETKEGQMTLVANRLSELKASKATSIDFASLLGEEVAEEAEEDKPIKA